MTAGPDRQNCFQRALPLLAVLICGCAAPKVDQAAALRLARQADQAYEAGDLKRAKALYEELSQLSPQSATPHVRLGAIAYRGGDARRARAHFESAASKDPRNAQAKYNLAMLHMNDAAVLLKEYVQLAPRAAHVSEANAALAALQQLAHDPRTSIAQPRTRR